MSDRVDHVLARLPRGNALDDAAWAPRHRLLLWLLAAHIPALAVTGWLLNTPVTAALLWVLPVALALLIGVGQRSRLVCSVAVTLGLVYSASVLVHFTGGRVEAHFHYFVVLGFAALYQDWRPYLLAVGYVVVGNSVVPMFLRGSMFDDPSASGRPWLWALLHAGFVLAASTAHIIGWKQTERQQQAAAASFAKLYEGERAVVSQLRQAQRVKNELIGIVGHEFRTPLTSIQGFARTLEARHERMDDDAIRTCTQAIEREAKRLTRMVANVLAASEDMVASGSDVCRVSDVARRVAAEIVETTPTAAHILSLHVAEEHAVRMRAEHAQHLLFSLLDNAVKFAVPESDVRLTSRREADMIVVEVTNVGSPISPEDRERIFEAFVQGDSSDSRRYGGMGLGLHIARTIVEAYGGRVAAYCEGPLVIFRAWLPRVTTLPDDPPRVERAGTSTIISEWAFH